MEKIFRVVDGIGEWTGKGAGFLMAGLVLAICYDILVRYALNKPTAWGFEMTYMVYGAYSVLGVAYCQRLKGHVRMGFLYSKLTPRVKARVEVIYYLLTLFPVPLGAHLQVRGAHPLVRDLRRAVIGERLEASPGAIQARHHLRPRALHPARSGGFPQERLRRLRRSWA